MRSKFQRRVTWLPAATAILVLLRRYVVRLSWMVLHIGCMMRGHRFRRIHVALFCRWCSMPWNHDPGSSRMGPQPCMFDIIGSTTNKNSLPPFFCVSYQIFRVRVSSESFWGRLEIYFVLSASELFSTSTIL